MSVRGDDVTATLGALEHPSNQAANERALAALFGADPRLIDVRPAIEALPGMRANLILTSGPPLPWAEYTGGQRRAIHPRQ